MSSRHVQVWRTCTKQPVLASNLSAFFSCSRSCYFLVSDYYYNINNYQPILFRDLVGTSCSTAQLLEEGHFSGVKALKSSLNVVMGRKKKMPQLLRLRGPRSHDYYPLVFDGVFEAQLRRRTVLLRWERRSMVVLCVSSLDLFLGFTDTSKGRHECHDWLP